jgi:predicted kinase
MIVIVFGLPGTGKSYLAYRLAAKIDAVYFKSDRIRKEMLNKRTYSVTEKLSVYNEMLYRLIDAVKKNKNVVADATFSRRDTREKFITKSAGTENIRFVEVIADESLIRERLKETREDTEADFEVYKNVRQEWEPMEEPHLVLESTNNNIEEMLQKALAYLQLKG